MYGRWQCLARLTGYPSYCATRRPQPRAFHRRAPLPAVQAVQAVGSSGTHGTTVRPREPACLNTGASHRRATAPACPTMVTAASESTSEPRSEPGYRVMLRRACVSRAAAAEYSALRDGSCAPAVRPARASVRLVPRPACAFRSGSLVRTTGPTPGERVLTISPYRHSQVNERHALPSAIENRLSQNLNCGRNVPTCNTARGLDSGQ